MEILTPTDREAINKALEQAEVLRKEIAKAKRAGIDVSALEARLSEAELALRNIRNVYFPKRS